MTAMRPITQFIKTESRKCFFSYPYNMTTFQTGFLGVGPSKVSGGFHLRYPSSTPIYISRIDATLVGQEAISFFSHDDLQKKKRIFYETTKCIYQSSIDFTPETCLDLNFEFSLEDGIPPSYSSPLEDTISLSQNTIKYEIKITIFRKCNFFKLQRKKKSISMICQIDRYSLPSTLKLRNAPIPMNCSKLKKKRSDSKLDLIQIAALLPSEYIDMNSIMVIPLTFILPDSKMKIEEIYVAFKEYQTIKDENKDLKDDEKEICYFERSKRILEYKSSGKDIEIVEEDTNKYFIELKLDVPTFDSIDRFLAFEGVKITEYLKYSDVRHVLKIKIKFENEGELVLKENIWLQRSLKEKRILKERERGTIF